ncbi:hypothetical protein QE369_003216 [Agrobacterium larrymoorei]|uniref:Uncharacterized protein n=1 Tax=Agrobacterium larrymoorei TaxID=160699 RepID=A0AAJ2BCI7_9HYPH|nr:hypothetical protein [Agrobacterium larrymoorei]MDR6103019.1 hypothetical protein [Agrobacterium larrymoorei]
MLSAKSNHAVYLPAISANYAKLGHSLHFKRTFAFSERDLNFLDPASGLFHYPYALYSAGQAAKTDGAANQTNLVSHRDRDRTTVIGDSGGFQIQEGTIKFTGDATCERMLRWMESHSDFSMSLDFPTGGISPGNVAQHTARLDAGGKITAMSAANSLSLDYNACLTQSLLNLDYFVRNRIPTKTNLLNVIQGRTERESKVWYEAVKAYSLEGWAFAGAHQSAFSLTIARLLDMIDDGLLQKAKWIHFLGISTLEPAYLFTTILRCLRRYNPEIGISFDTSSPFIAAANFNMYTSFRFDKYGCAFSTVSVAEHANVDDIRTLNDISRDFVKEIVIARTGAPERRFTPLPVATAIGSRVTVAEICELKDNRWRITTDGVWILMNHNVEIFKKAFEALNRSFDENPWHDDMPVYVRAAKVAIELIFEKHDSTSPAAARALLKESALMLDVFADMRN